MNRSKYGKHPRMSRWKQLTLIEAAAVLVFIPGLVLIPALRHQVGVSWSVAVIIWVTLFLYLQMKNMRWRCPRCGKRFHQTQPDPLDRNKHLRRFTAIGLRCMNCGVRRGDPKYS